MDRREDAGSNVDETGVMPVGHPARLSVSLPSEAQRTAFGRDAEIQRLNAIIAALKNDVTAARARNLMNEHLMGMAADRAGGGRAWAEFRLAKIVDITLEMVGVLIGVDEIMNKRKSQREDTE